MKKATELQNVQMPAHELKERAEAAVKKYLEVANRSGRNSSNLPNVLWAFFDFSHDSTVEYRDILLRVLLALSKKEIVEPLGKEIGQYFIGHLAKIIERTIYMIDTVIENEACTAEIIAVELDNDGDYEKDEIGNRIYLNDLIRHYQALAENTEASQADWAAHDQRVK